MKREWQNWDVGGVAQAIDDYWRRDSAESTHRENLVRLTAQFVRPNCSILEVGCGSGLIYERLVPVHIANSQYQGVDVSQRMLEIARRNFPAGRFLHGDGYKLEFEDKAFDLVICFEVLGHIPNNQTFINELLRVTREVCIFTIWPSADHQVVEQYEYVDGTRFLHRQYPNSYVQDLIRTARPWSAGADQVVPVSPGVMAYIVQSYAAIEPRT
jgi:ubiquinone/menaquinone biosynthesis C-methylase UbiE